MAFLLTTVYSLSLYNLINQGQIYHLSTQRTYHVPKTFLKSELQKNDYVYQLIWMSVASH